jgi:hypothetical protein
VKLQVAVVIESALHSCRRFVDSTRADGKLFVARGISRRNHSKPRKKLNIAAMNSKTSGGWLID